jgi:hypothetical protein
MQWTDIDHSFCEEHLLGLPEYYNSISSLVIVFFGVYGLMNMRNDLFIDILYASLAIVGVGSTGYHWHGNIGWALFDEMPIIVTVFSGIIYTDNVHYLICNNKVIKDRDKNDDNMNMLTSSPHSCNKIYSKKISLLIYLLGMYTFLISNVMSNYRMIFPQLFTGVVTYLYYKIYLLVRILDPFFQSMVLSKVRNSCLIICASGAVWTFTEISCKYVDYYILLLGHPMWHFFIGHGFYNLIQVIYYIKLHNANLRLNYNSAFLLQISPNSFDYATRASTEFSLSPTLTHRLAPDTSVSSNRARTISAGC